MCVCVCVCGGGGGGGGGARAGTQFCHDPPKHNKPLTSTQDKGYFDLTMMSFLGGITGIAHYTVTACCLYIFTAQHCNSLHNVVIQWTPVNNTSEMHGIVGQA